MAKVAEVLRKTKRSLDDEHDMSKNKKADKDDKKGGKRSSLLDFIAKAKNNSKK